MFELEDGISPRDLKPVTTRKDAVNYPLGEMQVGQSFVVPVAGGNAMDSKERNKHGSRVHAAIDRYRRKHPGTPRKFTVRYDVDAEGFRVFRLGDKDGTDAR